jgi:hypothetical protein
MDGQVLTGGLVGAERTTGWESLELHIGTSASRQRP